MSLEIHLEAVIECVCKWTWRPSLREDGIHFEAMVDRVWRYTWRPSSCQFGDTLGGCDRAGLEMLLEALFEGVWRCTCRPWSSEIGGVHWGCPLGGGSLGGRHDGSLDSNHQLIRICGNVENWVQHGLLRDREIRNSLGAGSQLILGWCSTWWMQYSVYAVLSVNSWSWHGETKRDDFTSCF